MKYFLILNPGSKGGKSRKKFKTILDILEENNISYDYKITTTLEDATVFSAEANQKGYDVIVSVGGDGTINRVINGFFDPYGKRISHSKLGVIYTGTSPDFCKSYHVPLKIENAMGVLISAKSKKIQIGKISHALHFEKILEGQALPINYHPMKTSYFACCANIGIGASLAKNANSGIRKWLGDYGGTFISLIKALKKYEASSFTVTLDGKKQILQKVYNIGVGRTTFIASGIKVKNNLQPGDGLFYNLIIKNISFFNCLGILKKIYSGKDIINGPIIALKYAKVIEIYGCNKNPELEFDGDASGYLPCLIESTRDPLDLICEVQNE